MGHDGGIYIQKYRKRRQTGESRDSIGLVYIVSSGGQLPALSHVTELRTDPVARLIRLKPHQCFYNYEARQEVV
jgi:hypothetical protein